MENRQYGKRIIMTFLAKQLESEALALSVRLSQGEIEKFIQFAALLISWNQKINLTAITQPDQVITKHFVDSLSLLQWIDRDKPSKIIDVGTGAGFPGLPLAVVSPAKNITLLDSIGKRFLFIEEVIRRLAVKNVACVKSRAEEAGQNPFYRERFDAVVSRAVAPMRVLAELCLPFVKPGGFFYAMKGSDIEPELKNAADRIKIMGGHIEAIERITLANEEKRSVVIICKTHETPWEYPRRPNQIKREQKHDL
jgi:16S rRNA (guanine(527)-N(7))-methyltransferase RsmG